MARSPLLIRDAGTDDVGDLREVLADMPTRDLDHGCPRDGARVVARVNADPDQRLVVAEQEGRVVGAMLLARGSLTPLHSDLVLHILHLHVRPEGRRHGVGRALVEAAVSWAEEKETSHILASSSVGSRDANRFLARLGLGQVAVIRASSVSALRAKLPADRASGTRGGRRRSAHVGQVVALRRSQRRAQERIG